MLIALLLAITSYAADEISVSCLKVYEEGGAPAVLESRECPQWCPSSLSQDRAQNCQFSTLQGRREYQEDRVTCNLQLKVAVTGKDGPKEEEIGVAAIFDGHGGKEASELSYKNFLDYFTLNVAFTSYQQAFSCNSESDFVSQENKKDIAVICGRNSRSSEDGVLGVGNVITLQKILKIALLRTFRDIDYKFSQEAISKRYLSGSTATVVVLVDGQILVANVGDTKALLCSKRIETDSEFEDASTTRLQVAELTRDHHPDREDEKARIEAAGGFVHTWGVPRVNGILSVSRAIGDLSLKRYGVSPVPELYGWRNLTVDDSYLVVASDGIFERQTPQEVCDVIEIQEKKTSKASSTSSPLADHIVRKAYKGGSSDNLSAILIPLQLHRSSEGSAGRKCEL